MKERFSRGGLLTPTISVPPLSLSPPGRQPPRPHSRPDSPAPPSDRPHQDENRRGGDSRYSSDEVAYKQNRAGWVQLPQPGDLMGLELIHLSTFLKIRPQQCGCKFLSRAEWGRLKKKNLGKFVEM